MKALILTAGLGTRFQPQTLKQAKPSLPFLNIPILGYPLFHIEKLKPTDVIFNLHHLPETVRTAVDCVTGGTVASASASAGAAPLASAAGARPSYKVHFTDETAKILGSGGGIRNAETLLRGGPFVVCNGDEIFFFSQPAVLENFFKSHCESGALATLLTTDHPLVGVSLNGLRVNERGEVTEYSVREKGLAHFTGVFAFSDRVFDFMPKSGDFHIFKDVLVQAALRGEKINAYHISAKEMTWYETGDEKQYIEANSHALAEWAKQDQSPYIAEMRSVFTRYQQRLQKITERIWAGANTRFDATLDPDAFALVGANSVVSSSVHLRGHNTIGFHCVIDRGAIENSVVAPTLHLRELVSLKNQLLV